METIVDFLPYSISSLKGIQFFHEIGNIQYVCWFYDFYKQCLRVNFIWQSQLKTVEVCRAVPDSAESPQIANIRRSWIISFKDLF